jgi:hypothetical protein
LELYAVNNTLFKVVQPTRGVGVRQNGPQKGKISGTYRKVGGNVEVTLKLIDTGDNRTMQMATFSLPVSDLEKMDIALFPANNATEAEVRAREEILAPVKTGEQASISFANNNSLTIEAWPNSITRTYYDGEALIISLLANRSCYVKVYHIGVDGKQQMIFPNQIDRDNRLEANTEFRIPRNSRFVLGSPYGQETIIAVASGLQFENLESEMVRIVNATQESVAGIVGERGLSVQDGRARNVAGGAIVNTRFTFTILRPSSENETLSYGKPGNMREFVQTMRSEIEDRGGQFNGNELEGSFYETGIQGTYRVSGDNIIFTIRQERNRTTQPSTRGINTNRGYNFSFDRPGDIRQAVNTVKTGIAQKGGSFNGDERTGSFTASGISGEYNIVDKVDVTIIEKPRVIPNSLIEKEVKKFFGVR